MNVWAVLLGGGVTLAGTFAIQLLIVPWVQRRTRGRERWENDVDAIYSAVAEKVSLAVATADRSGHNALMARSFLQTAEHDETLNREFLTATIEGARTADEALAERMAEVRILLRRISRVNPDSPYWDQLALQFLKLHNSIRRAQEGEPGKWFDEWQHVYKALNGLHRKIDDLADRVPLRPPARPTIFSRSRTEIRSKLTMRARSSPSIRHAREQRDDA
ncbi:hypothetical protein Ais01nite_47710 [Asanoa ishikariensis]|uniref:hypothetical protein n=1 Tax=Asanoa ishikariensis TaxID=137265 RepID=UPI00115F810F|nr:hypothetical protein [Asanoa ishikariensis]GIF66736.1 hypothetical protein Ais01nite_47710 [Asanoa ishikariensis]